MRIDNFMHLKLFCDKIKLSRNLLFAMYVCFKLDTTSFSICRSQNARVLRCPLGRHRRWRLVEVDLKSMANASLFVHVLVLFHIHMFACTFRSKSGNLGIRGYDICIHLYHTVLIHSKIHWPDCTAMLFVVL